MTIPITHILHIDSHIDLFISSTLNGLCTTIFRMYGRYCGKGTTPIHTTPTGRRYIIRYQRAYYIDQFTPTHYTLTI